MNDYSKQIDWQVQLGVGPFPAIGTCVYLAGPMRGLPDLNFPAFDRMAADLRDSGYQVINPADLDRELDAGNPRAHTFHDYMRRDIAALTTCDWLMLLDGWETSEGANIEKRVAHAMGMPVLDQRMRQVSQFYSPFYGSPMDEGTYIPDTDASDMCPHGQAWGVPCAACDDPEEQVEEPEVDDEVFPDDAWGVADPSDAEETILEEAERLVAGARNSDYGHPAEDFDQLGRMWGAILTRQYPEAPAMPDLPGEVVGLMMVALKLNREAGKSKRDNLVDGAGYLRCVERISRRREGKE